MKKTIDWISNNQNKVFFKLVQLVKPTFRFCLAWTFLNVLINLNYPAPEPNIAAPLLPSPEITGLILILGAAVWFGMPFLSAIYLPLTLLIVFFRMFRIGDVLIPNYFNRSFNLYIDTRYIFDLFHLLYNTVSQGALIGYALLGLSILAMIFWGVWKALETVHNFLLQKHHRMILTGVLAVLIVLSLTLSHIRQDRRLSVFAKASLHRVIEEIDFIMHIQRYNKKTAAIIQEAVEKAGRIPTALDKLSGTNVFLFFIESYGHTVFDEPRHLSMVELLIRDFELDLKANGFSAFSNFLKAPTYGGASWLSHGTLAGGIYLDNQIRYNFLTTSNVKTIARYFNKAGYRTVHVMPGTTRPWPEGEFFGYQKKYYAWHFGYKGPRYGWSPMPDQYVLDFIHRREIQPRKQPLFIEFVLVTSHAPFHMQPPYLEDWSQIKNGRVYQRKEIIYFPVKWPDLTEASDAYMTSILYELKVLKTFIKQYVSDKSLIIIMGDHQPNAQITGKNRPWSVPVHVISRNRHLLQPFAARGYTSGLIPRQSTPHPGMETFLHNFLTDFSTTFEKRSSNRR